MHWMDVADPEFQASQDRWHASEEYRGFVESWHNALETGTSDAWYRFSVWAVWASEHPEAPHPHTLRESARESAARAVRLETEDTLETPWSAV